MVASFPLILAWSKMKAFADDKSNIARMMISDYDRIENIFGKGENADEQHFLLSPTMFFTLPNKSFIF